ncbi:DUF1796 family putative cysteine peptidase [Chitinophaga solisilvae]|uniref:Uncharacterized protein n=1 Tax=Chitinophaga solisilvae TaxID=1233460 RepID=A0A433WFT8_9BACT|nr:DUF1796 family putative cysteine peptidase [Chitinophaga solisilvae]NSL87198.1 hypothetical protein [Chitinophaga solisilvae]
MKWTLFKRKEVIIPLGCDCHPAYVLARLGHRKRSLPFDWISLHPLTALAYVHENIITDFRYFLHSLQRNEEGHVYAERFPETTFYHHGDIIDKKKTYRAFVRRGRRFMKYVRKRRCTYLYNIASVNVDSPESVQQLTAAAVLFCNVLKKDDRCWIYIRYDESYEENRLYCDMLYEALRKTGRIAVVRYIRYKEKFDIWGDETAYQQLLDSFLEQP